jgi:cytosine/adenosine deaminase-related metal-dependent hydrolase
MNTLLLASHVAPMTAPLIRDGAVAFNHHRILAVGPARELQTQHPDAQIIDLANSLILPGLVNPHVHLELTNIHRPTPAPPTFVDWILSTRDQISRIPDLATFLRESTLAGIRQSVRFGVTTIGDITLNPTITRPLIKDSGLRGLSFGEVLGMAGRSAQLEQRLNEATDRQCQTKSLRAGIEPHAPYSLDLTGYRRCLEQARQHGMPLATHLAETPDETVFLANHQGEFRRLWDALGSWQEGVTQFKGGPVRAMKSLGLLDHTPTLLAHVNYASDDELDILAASNASVTYCPRTHAYFNHPPHRFRDMLARGINVTIGTDSCASSPDLNLLEDLRLLHRLHPDIPPMSLFEMITTRAAKALGMQHHIGCLMPGAGADFCAFHMTSQDPLAAILDSNDIPSQVWLRGQCLDTAP